MNLMPKLAARAEAGRPVRCALIGAGKFGSMFLAQVPHIEGLEVAVIADLDPERARNACRAVGWDETRIAGTRFVEQAAYRGQKRQMRTGKDTDPDDRHILFNCRAGYVRRRAPDSGVDDFHAGIEQAARDDARPHVMTIKADFSDKHALTR